MDGIGDKVCTHFVQSLLLGQIAHTQYDLILKFCIDVARVVVDKGRVNFEMPF
jgi:hypothetical protein